LVEKAERQEQPKVLMVLVARRDLLVALLEMILLARGGLAVAVRLVIPAMAVLVETFHQELALLVVAVVVVAVMLKILLVVGLVF
jgi:hypothetical protein